MIKKFAYLATFLTLIGLFASIFALSSKAAKETRRAIVSAPPAAQPLPSLRGPAAVERLKQEGLYDSLAQAVAAANPLIVQQAKLTASDSMDFDAFGSSVAISEDTAVIGASQAQGTAPAQGSVHVFVRRGRGWTSQARLTAPGAAASDHFGASVAISGDFLVVGAPDDDIGANTDQGSAHVFARRGETWRYQQILALNDGAANDYFGASVAIDAKTVVIGVPGASGTRGSACVFAPVGGTWIERQRLVSMDGAAGDNFGASVAIDAGTIVVGAPYQDIGQNANQGSAYVFTRSGDRWNQRQKLMVQDGVASASFGASVTVEADTIVVGAPYDRESASDNQGSAHVFARDGASWSHQAKLTATDGARLDLFGSSVAIDAGTVVIGSAGADRFRGAAYVFARDGANWSKSQRLASEDGEAGGFFGKSVAISGDLMMVGTPRTYGTVSHSGSAYAFAISGDLAQRQQFMIGRAATSGGAIIAMYDNSVAISGDTTVVGLCLRLPGDGGFTSAVYVFARGDGGWNIQQILFDPEESVLHRFGASVAISGNTIVVGDDAGRFGDFFQGAAYVYTRNGASWGAPRKLTPDDGVVNNLFGCSVAIYADTVVVGAIGSGDGQGAAYVFARNGADWIQRQKLTAPDGEPNDEFGRSVAIDSETLVIGATGDDSHQGSVYVFRYNGQGWVQRQKLTADDGGADAYFGDSVAISGETVVVGAKGDNSSRGAAYVFASNAEVFTEPTWIQRQKLTASDGSASAQFGASVAISGGIIVVGALGVTGRTFLPESAAYIFVRRLRFEQYQKLPLRVPGGVTSNLFGKSVAISGDTIIATNWTPVNEHQWGDMVYVFTCGGCPNIDLAPADLPEAEAGSPYNQTVTANGGSAPYRFSLSSGSLPPGLTLSQDGSFSGVPTTEGAYSFTIAATAANLCHASRDYTLIVRPRCQAITIDPTLPAGAAGQPYSFTFTATGGAAPYNFQVSKGAPPGLKLSPDGTLAGVPTSAGKFKFTVTASDSNGCSGSNGYSLTINAK